MSTFEALHLNKHLQFGIDDLGFEKPTPIQEQSFSVQMSGKDVVGIAQTGTGKTLAYMLPILQQHKFSKAIHPTVLILVPTRELVEQTVDKINDFAQYISIRVKGVYGGANINTQMQELAHGADIVVATPGRLYDLALNNGIQLKAIKKLVLDEVDVLLDLGFLFQLTNIFELLPERRQNIMFSATMTEEVDEVIDTFFTSPTRISIAVSGTPLDNIKQVSYPVYNFYTKVNLLIHLLASKKEYKKVVVFTGSKKQADKLVDLLHSRYGREMGVVHSNKSQNYRFKAVKEFDAGEKRIFITTDILARGLDIDKISHVINFDVPTFPENYMHRIGRTGRAEVEGNSILFYTDREAIHKENIERLMGVAIPILEMPEEVQENRELLPEEREVPKAKNHNRNDKLEGGVGGFHEKLPKNKKVNLGSAYWQKVKTKYKKPIRKGDKIANNRAKKKK